MLTFHLLLVVTIYAAIFSFWGFQFYSRIVFFGTRKKWESRRLEIGPCHQEQLLLKFTTGAPMLKRPKVLLICVFAGCVFILAVSRRSTALPCSNVPLADKPEKLKTNFALTVFCISLAKAPQEGSARPAGR